ncbi:MAG: prolipoprotein diacylglyceryl transferase [Gammaproteobacteria bacterium]|nr:prolipoprotein diacylglyceryl transferase [Gammaproteobacteria bacterium]
MINAPAIDPVAFGIGPLKVHWYGLMYLFGFAGAWLVGGYRAGRQEAGWEKQEISDLVFYFAIGAILGGRIGYILFYNLGHYLSNPIEIFYIWAGGMSFHGGLLGAISAMWLYGRHTQRTFFAVTDFAAVLTPIGLFFGRIGNFINQELWGRVTDGPWGMIFKTGGPLPRHPSQLYEATLEGVALFVILWVFSNKARPIGFRSGLFLCGYGVFRFLVEFARQPDVHIGYLAFNWFTMGQLLSLPMILFGIWLIWRSYNKPA